MTASKSTTYKVTGKLTLNDLREFVAQTQDADETTRVSITSFKGDMRDPGYDTISVTVTETK